MSEQNIRQCSEIEAINKLQRSASTTSTLTDFSDIGGHWYPKNQWVPSCEHLPIEEHTEGSKIAEGSASTMSTHTDLSDIGGHWYPKSHWNWSSKQEAIEEELSQTDESDFY